VKQSSKRDRVVLCPRQMEGAVAKLQEEDEAHLVGKLWLMSSGTVSRVGLSGAAPQADGGGSGQAPGGG